MKKYIPCILRGTWALIAFSLGLSLTHKMIVMHTPTFWSILGSLTWTILGVGAVFDIIKKGLPDPEKLKEQMKKMQEEAGRTIDDLKRKLEREKTNPPNLAAMYSIGLKDLINQAQEELNRRGHQAEGHQEPPKYGGTYEERMEYAREQQRKKEKIFSAFGFDFNDFFQSGRQRQQNNYYDIYNNIGKRPTFQCFTDLGIKAGANKDQVKAAFHAKAKTAHPDKGGSKEQFQKLQEAYKQCLQYAA